MQIILNGEIKTLATAMNVKALIEDLQLKGKLAVEVNKEIIPKSQYETHILNNNDKVEIIQAIGGG